MGKNASTRGKQETTRRDGMRSIMVAALLVATTVGYEMASQCAAVNEACGEGVTTQYHGHVMHESPDIAAVCCDGLTCEQGTCQRPWGASAPTAEDLMALYVQFAPEQGVSVERATQMMTSWRGREERLLTSVRL